MRKAIPFLVGLLVLMLGLIVFWAGGLDFTKRSPEMAGAVAGSIWFGLIAGIMTRMLTWPH